MDGSVRTVSTSVSGTTWVRAIWPQDGFVLGRLVSRRRPRRATRGARLATRAPPFPPHVNATDMPTLFVRCLPGRLLVLAAVVVAAGSGCSGKGVKKVTVSGTVSYKGQKLQSGILKFVGPEGAYSAASIQSDGTYIMTDVVPGEVKVGVMEAPQGSGSSSGEQGAGRPEGAARLPAREVPGAGDVRGDVHDHPRAPRSWTSRSSKTQPWADSFGT